MKAGLVFIHRGLPPDGGGAGREGLSLEWNLKTWVCRALYYGSEKHKGRKPDTHAFNEGHTCLSAAALLRE